MRDLSIIKNFMKNLKGEWQKPVILEENEIRIRLEELEFNALIRGGEVHVKRKDGPDVRFILADIGFHRMEHCLNGAICGVKSFKEESVVVDG